MVFICIAFEILYLFWIRHIRLLHPAVCLHHQRCRRSEFIRIQLSDFHFYRHSSFSSFSFILSYLAASRHDFSHLFLTRTGALKRYVKRISLARFSTRERFAKRYFLYRELRILAERFLFHRKVLLSHINISRYFL